MEGDSLDSVVGDVTRYIERVGGNILRTDRWGLRRLAYPIRDNWEGHYFLMYVEFEPEAIAEFEQSLHLLEPVMRHLIVLSQDKVGREEPRSEDSLDLEDDWDEGDVEDGSAEDGSAEDGSAEDGGAEDGGAEDGSAEDGSAEDGGDE